MVITAVPEELIEDANTFWTVVQPFCVVLLDLKLNISLHVAVPMQLAAAPTCCVVPFSQFCRTLV